MRALYGEKSLQGEAVCMMKRMSVILFFLCLCLCGCGGFKGGSPKQKEVSREIFAMNTYVTITAYADGANGASDALDAAVSRIREFDSLWSVTDEKSEIYRLNHSGGKPFTVSEPTLELIQTALFTAKKTGGALNPAIYPVLKAWGFTTDSHRIPEKEKLNQLLQLTDYTKIQVKDNDIIMPDGMQLDMGAIAKGYAGDEAAEILKAGDIDSAIISLGGNIQTVGKKPDGSPWKIGIQSPVGDDYFAVLETGECAVVTSGGYQNYFKGEDGKVYHHIIDPKTGRPAESGLLSVTVVGKEGKMCDALSTAFYVMGEKEAIRYWRENDGFDIILYTDEDEIIITEGLEDTFKLRGKYEDFLLNVKRK